MVEIMIYTDKRQQGFSLVEMAVVLVIIGLLLGGLLVPLSAQMEQERRSRTISLLDEVKEAMLGFAVANDRLPCPAIPASAGVEAPLGGGICTNQFGFVPVVTLGLAGETNADGLLLDAWGNPLRYSVTRTGGSFAFTTFNSISFASSPDLVVCDAASASGASCSTGMTLVSNAPAVLYSMGKDGASPAGSATQTENAEANLGGGPMGLNYRVSSNRVFTHAPYREDTGNQFDDLVTWISSSILYNRMVKAGVLP